MVMCKYFLRGSCRFGDACKNEHSYNVNDTSSSIMRKKSDIDINVLIKAVSNDMDKAEKGNQWPLSCYGPFQAKPCFPGFEDKCFEEIRLGMYEAEKSGAVEQYKQQLTQILHEARMKMRSLQNPTAEASHVLQELYNTNSPEQQQQQQSSNVNVFSNTNNTFSNSPIQSNSVFSNNNSGVVGGASKSIFNNQTTQSNFTFAAPENKSIFGNTAPTNKNSIFTGGGNNSIFTGNQPQQSFQSTNIFKTANNSIFGGGQQPTQTQTTSNIFQQPPPNPFKQNIQQAPAPSGQSPFGAQQQQQQQQQSPFVNQLPSVAPFGGQPFGGAYVPAPSQPQFHQSPFSAHAQSPFTTLVAPPSFGNEPVPPSFANQTPFVAPQAPLITENRSIFAQNSQTNASDHSRSIFGGSTSQSTVVAAAPAPLPADDPTIYSKLEALTEEDVKCFQATTFEFGKIPDKPPTLQMCSYKLYV